MRFSRNADPQHDLGASFLMAMILVFVFTFHVLAFAEKAKPGNCAACHGADAVLPKGHAPTSEMNVEDCLECHEKGSPITYYSKIPLGHVHQLSGVTCLNCHGDTKTPRALSTGQCLACHGSLEKIAAKTVHVKPHNPHSSPHGKPYTACDLCHYQHKQSENFCAQCHDFTYIVP